MSFKIIFLLLKSIFLLHGLPFKTLFEQQKIISKKKAGVSSLTKKHSLTMSKAVVKIECQQSCSKNSTKYIS
jgi:hypothetical protein